MDLDVDVAEEVLRTAHLADPWKDHAGHIEEPFGAWCRQWTEDEVVYSYKMSLRSPLKPSQLSAFSAYVDRLAEALWAARNGWFEDVTSQLTFNGAEKSCRDS